MIHGNNLSTFSCHHVNLNFKHIILTNSDVTIKKYLAPYL